MQQPHKDNLKSVRMHLLQLFRIYRSNRFVPTKTCKTPQRKCGAIVCRRAAVHHEFNLFIWVITDRCPPQRPFVWQIEKSNTKQWKYLLFYIHLPPV